MPSHINLQRYCIGGEKVKLLGHVCLTIFLMIFWIAVGSTTELELDAKSALLMDARSGEILFAENIEQPLPIASISKLMTLILALEAVDEKEIALTDLVTTSEHAASMGGSQVWLEAGEQLMLKEMLYAIAVGSANDAAVAVAEYIGGSENNFVELMNDQARKLGLTKTQYSNASGLPPSLLGIDGIQVMSAQDVANLARYALDVPLLMEFVSTYEYTMRADTTKRPVLWNYNKLLRRYQGVNGMKTGFTTEAGYCLAASAIQDELQLLAVTLGSSSESQRESDITKLLDYGYRKYKNHLVFAQEHLVGELKLFKADQEFVNTLVANDFYVTIQRGDEHLVTTSIIYDDQVLLPLHVNTKVGTIIARIDDQVLGEMDLVAEQTVDRSNIFKLIKRTFTEMIKIIAVGS